MRYRAKNDTILEYNGKESLIAKGDKVFVQQHDTRWKVFSFFTRELIYVCSTEELHQWFIPEEDFQKPLRGDRFKGRKFGNKLMTMLVCLLPLISTAQTSPVSWRFEAVRVDSNYFELHITADIYRGWWIYKPNRADICPYSPIITFEKNPLIKPIEGVDAIESVLCTNEMSEGPPMCPIPQYQNSVTFVQLFKVLTHEPVTVHGRIKYQALSRYTIEPLQSIDFFTGTGGFYPIRTSCTAGVVATYPRGIFRKTWWFIKHPFGPYYISKRIFHP